MKREFEMSMVGELNYFLGLQVKQRKDGIFISQEKYAKNIVKRFGLDSKKHTSTPMSSLEKLSLDVAGADVDPTLYRSMIGSLLYLTTSRLDIAFSVGVCARFQAAPKESQLTTIKRIIRYINDISDYGIWYLKDSNECLAEYSDVDWARCIDDRKSTSGGCFYLGNNLLSWMSKKQNLVSLSTMSPTKHSASKKPTSKRARIDSNNFKSMEVDLKYNDCYKRTTIIMERVVKLDTLEDTCILAVVRERTWTKLLNPVGVVYSEIIRVFLQC
ncbi:uncharacterized mitochondrial protein AtMg00810-like [Quercus robur]|uniref:uncharacterized mitochondrial protein AtMg00810-like n=1 Tax=Quercus robur TaxID=38942 RepID=UPI0021636546|nr:uncharacterized mitochondrial protein AtMg00810-like [Quercus robur]